MNPPPGSVKLIGVDDMQDPMMQAARKDDVDNMLFQEAVNAQIPIVKDSRTFFDVFIQDNYPEVYDNLPEEFMALIHTGLVCYKQFNGTDNSVFRKFEDEAYQEAIRRAEG